MASMNKLFSLGLLLVGLLIVPLGIGMISAETAPTSDARYRITFDATWSPTTHPHPNFPSNDHWSALVGATHNDSIHLWEMGQLATPGMKSVAEFGSNGVFNSEVNAAITAGSADQWIQAGFSPFSGVASASAEITATSDFPLLSLATMVAPSPDWFSGVDSLSLLDGNGNWKNTFTVNVYPYDAGTDSGSLYTSGNIVTSPFEPIADYTGVSPFSAEPLGTLTLTLISPQPELNEKLYLPLISR